LRKGQEIITRKRHMGEWRCAMSHIVIPDHMLGAVERAEPRAAGASPEGERLDEARAEFRVAWAAKVSEKRHQAAWARMRAASLNRVTREIRLAGVILGAIAGATRLTGGHGFANFLAGLLLGMLFGFLVVTPLLFFLEGVAGANHLKAERLERAARELERQVDGGAAPAASVSGSTSEATLPEAGDTSFDEARMKFRAVWSAKLAGK
jgi:hypothetical protein